MTSSCPECNIVFNPGIYVGLCCLSIKLISSSESFLRERKAVVIWSPVEKHYETLVCYNWNKRVCSMTQQGLENSFCDSTINEGGYYCGSFR